MLFKYIIVAIYGNDVTGCKNGSTKRSLRPLGYTILLGS